MITVRDGNHRERFQQGDAVRTRRHDSTPRQVPSKLPKVEENISHPPGYPKAVNSTLPTPPGQRRVFLHACRAISVFFFGVGVSQHQIRQTRPDQTSPNQSKLTNLDVAPSVLWTRHTLGVLGLACSRPICFLPLTLP